VLLVRRSVAEKFGLPILGKFVTIGMAGVKVDVMGIGPAFAIPKALKNAGLTDSDVDFYEINGTWTCSCDLYDADCVVRSCRGLCIASCIQRTRTQDRPGKGQPGGRCHRIRVSRPLARLLLHPLTPAFAVTLSDARALVKS
jgi:hypothetical protein